MVAAMTDKVRLLKNLSLAIGHEIRDSTALADKMNDAFATTGQSVRRTMQRMLVMASNSTVGWRAWVGVLSGVIFLFWYVWLT